MRTLRFGGVALLLAGLLACGGGGGGGNPAGGGTARDYERTESEPAVLPNGSGGFTASRVVTISNDDAGASRAVVSLAVPNGSLNSSPGSSGYQIQVTLSAEGDTEQEARAKLASMSVAHRDGVGGDTLYLQNEIELAPVANGENRIATVTATLPAALSYELYQSVENLGPVGSSGLSGTLARIEGENASANLSGTWDEATVYSSNLGVTVSGDVASLQAASNNGTVQASIPGTRNAVAILDSSNGNVDATVGRTLGTVFDLEASTDNGAATIVVAGTQPVGAQAPNQAHFRSTDYATGSPKVRVIARTDNLNASIHD